MPSHDRAGKGDPRVTATSVPSIESDAARAAADGKFGLFVSILDEVVFGAAILHSDGTFRYVNPYFATIHGYLPEELVGKNAALVHPADSPGHPSGACSHVTDEGLVVAEEHWHVRRDGTRVLLLVGCAAIMDGRGDERFRVLSAIDVSAVRHAESGYETLFREMLDGFAHHQIICDESGTPVDYRYLAANPAFERMTGLRARDIVGHTVLELLPNTEQRWIDTYGKVALTGEPVRFEDYAESLGKHFEVTAFRPAPGEFACNFLDVTARKKAEAALRHSEQALLRTQRAARLGSWTWNRETDEATWSDELFDVFGLDRTTRVPRLEEQSSIFSPDSYTRLTAGVAETLETGVPYDLELEIVRGDGTLGWCWARGERTADATGNPTGLWGAAQDITERKRDEDERLSLEAQLLRARKLESVGRLAGGLAHDFNNMLTVILGHVELNLERIGQDDPIYADLQEIRVVAERSTDLIRQLLAFASSQPSSPAIIDLNEKVSGTLQMLRRLIGEDIHLTWKQGENLSPIRIDPSQVDQILANLSVNARDAISGVGEITVETAAAHFDEEYCVDHPHCLPGDYVRLTVTDTGEGMSPEALEHLFEPFFTTKELGRGTGLGLATIYGIVKQNEGFIHASSESGVGTTFEVFFPQQTVEPKSPARPSRREVDVGGSETVLLVEDEPAILAMTSTMLRSRGYAVLPADTPDTALRLAREFSGTIDLLVTDVILPEMNGQELAGLLLESRPNLKGLFMSGFSAGVLPSNDHGEVTVPFLAKPFRPRELAAKVREVLDS